MPPSTYLEAADQFLNVADLQIGYGSFSNGCYLYWKGGRGDTRNAEFRCNKNKGHKFWIRKKGNDYLIGWTRGNTSCPLYWKGGSGNTKNAEFKCGQKGGKFWIRPIVGRMENRNNVIDTSDNPSYNLILLTSNFTFLEI